MKKFALFFVLLCALANANHLVLVGGGDYPAKAMSKFVEYAGGTEANLLVVSWATDDADYAYKRLKEAVAPFKPKKVVAAPHRNVMYQNKDVFLKQLDEATGVFFTGGDQVFIMTTAKLFPEIIPALRKKFRDGNAVYGGSSAGTAVMPRIMYTGEGDFTVINPEKVDMVEGLDLCPGILLDQHFIVRQRQNRLTSVLLRNEETDKKFKPSDLKSRLFVIHINYSY